MTPARTDAADYAIVGLVIASAIAIGLWMGGVKIPVSIPQVRMLPPIEQPPPEWREKAKPGDALEVPGFDVAYWGRGDSEYGDHASRKAEPFRALVYHYNVDKPAVNLVKYQHEGDRKRGGHYGYHVYVDKAGRIYQGAPLGVRTNHIKHYSDKHRKKGVAPNVWNANSIGVSAVGGCVLQAGTSITSVRCEREELTPRQARAMLAVGREIMRRYDIPCAAVYGHGDLQHDRSDFEGSTMAAAIKSDCNQGE